MVGIEFVGLVETARSRLVKPQSAGRWLWGLGKFAADG